MRTWWILRSRPAPPATSRTLRPSAESSRSSRTERCWGTWDGASLIRSSALRALVGVDQLVRRRRIGAREQPEPRLLVTQQSRDAGQRSQVLTRRALRPHHSENYLDGLAVDRLELDTTRTEQERECLRLGALERAVRDRNTVADAGALELLALQQQMLDFVGLHGNGRRQHLGETAQRVALRPNDRSVDVHQDPIDAQDIRESHALARMFG